MKAIQLAEPRQFRVIDLPEPADPGPGEAIVRVSRVGICGTDFSGYLERCPSSATRVSPATVSASKFSRSGAGVTHVKPADRAAVEPYINCQTCYSCARPHQLLRESPDTWRPRRRRPATVVHCPARKLHTSTKLSYEQLGARGDARDRPPRHEPRIPRADETVLVIGRGSDRSFGRRVCPARRLSRHRYGSQRAASRLRSEENGCGRNDHVVGVLDEDVKVFTELTGGKLGNVVVDATGSVRSMNVAYNFVGFTGRLVWVGITQDELHFTQPLMHRREMTFLASRNGQRTSSPGSFDSSRQECSIRGSGSRTARPSREWSASSPTG